MPPNRRTASRRELLCRTAVGAAAVGVGATASAGTAAADPDVTVRIDNVGASAWEVTEVRGADGVAQTGTENPTLDLTTGTRYEFENGGWSAHPFALRNVGGGVTTLLSQSGPGTFEGDDDVDWVDDGDAFSFRLTEALAAEANDYVCTVHGSMNGSVDTTERTTPNYDNPAGDVSFDAPADGARVTAPVTFEMSATDFVVEPSSEGVEPGHGHLHVLVDRPFVAPGETIPATEGYYHYGDGSTTAEIDLSPGDYTVRLQAGDANHAAYDLTDEIALTVRDPTLARFDRDGSGRIEADDVLDAVAAYSDGTTIGGDPVDAADLLEVIAAFNGNRPV